MESCLLRHIFCLICKSVNEKSSSSHAPEKYVFWEISVFFIGQQRYVVFRHCLFTSKSTTISDVSQLQLHGVPLKYIVFMQNIRPVCVFCSVFISHSYQVGIMGQKRV